LAGVLPFEKVFNQRFLNKTYKLETAVAEVKQKIEKVRTDLSTIDSVCGKYKLNAKGRVCAYPGSVKSTGRGKGA